MKSDGLTLLSGSPAVTNITVENGTALPAAVVGNKGRLFYLTQTDGSYTPGLYTSDGSAWVNGDISGVTAGSGLTGGGTTGNVTLSVDTNAIATRTYVDTAIAGLSWKTAVRAASTANITLSGTQTVDGVSLIAGDSVLLKNQTSSADNGIYVVAAGAWARRSDANSADELTGSAMYVREGTANADTAWVCTTDNITLGSTAVTFVQFNGGAAYTAGAGLSLTGNTFSVSPTVTPYDICSCVLGKPEAGATVFMALAVRSFTIPASYTASQAKASVAATASSVFTIYKNGSSIGTFTFASSGTIATFSGAGGSIVAGDLITITAPGSQDATLANIAFTIAGNLL